MKKQVLFTNEWRDFEETFGCTLEQYNKDYDMDYKEEWEVFSANEEFEYDELSYSLKQPQFEDLLVLADIGLWNGRRVGYKECSGDSITNGEYDYFTYSVEKGNLRVKGIHHDGTNFMLVRRWRENMSFDSRERFMSHLYNGTATPSMTNYYTEAIGNELMEVLGWA